MANNSQSRTARRKQKKAKKKPLWKKILLSIVIIFIVMGLGAGATAAYWIATAPDLDESKLSDPLASEFLDKDGKAFAVLGEKNRTKISYDDLPQVLIDAVTATEDARFFEHSGIDLRRIGGAIIANIKNGFGSEGASTITQQVVEKSFLSAEKKISLKVQEQWLALQLERDYSKEEIMEMYLNKIFYGSNAYGVAAAAETYFGKEDLNDLTLPEAAILAGLPQRPTAYNPFKNPELTKERMDTVLTLMVRHGKISEKEGEEARNVDIPSLLVEKKPETTPYEGFLQQVEKEVKEKVNGADIYTDGLKIHTTIDQSAQKHVESLLTDSDANPISYPDDEMQAAMTVLDTKTGAIRAIGGRRNSEGKKELNYAIQNTTQAGSTFKPIISYGPAIEYNKISTYHQINDDKPYPIPGTNKTIRNWNRQYAGWMTARHALNQSLNVPAVKVLEEVGYDKAKEFAEGLGIKFADNKILIGDAIGGTKTEVTPLQLAGAFRAFGNEGLYNEPYSVTKVEFPDGKTVELTPKAKPAMSDYTAYMMTDMMKTVVTEGTGKTANIPGLPVAGKTGTTSLPEREGSPDAWFSGYTTNYTISAWVGGYQDEEGKREPIPDGNTQIPLEMFKSTMTELSKDIETKDFVKPDSVVEAEVEKGSNPPAKPSAHTPADKIITELFVKGTEPKETSEVFDQLDPVSGLTASFNEDSNSIDVSWNYDSDADVSFEISAQIDGGAMQALSTTEDTSMKISQVEPNAKYTIQVVAVSNEDDGSKSEPKTTTVSTGEDEPDELPGVVGLTATYNDANAIIDVSWNYNGPPASFEVSVNGQSQTVESNGLEVSGAKPGETYTISVTPIGKEGENEGVRGPAQQTSVTVPAEQTEPPADDGEDGSGNGNGNGNGDGDNGSGNEDGNVDQDGSEGRPPEEEQEPEPDEGGEGNGNSETPPGEEG
ncbi:PBP1A family penicillin-binding protein [Virgibacillus pantothenticus]|uniref:PBP1A family penicillin-binding protein n=1 Tax=Virgibacillus pantothenticus TaxID=1473 RepID=UPI001C2412A9|nr:PBP1A family penicillin-binding protein [Virgibacillus pantothenticus]MBU8567853.1 PBP1A family penicillin-binding protein [Virgibacillus pantothenticus]MBU8601646.1 PBP1A family penicillin-binding protein [Virgibacillus pantothenticus]MBU8635887.1 PBP1A family penicillin-binding protein [Virgibacillus pantothenticus]MBU8641397.1 PBP1A family penicillin-binding protein [Virgibacillus pantothenticus]MBU8646150.1 PBP1A family penicillin-binding protein [Virgibacillus pantothenticus]